MEIRLSGAAICFHIVPAVFFPGYLAFIVECLRRGLNQMFVLGTGGRRVKKG
jgi:hypothetical protein